MQLRKLPRGMKLYSIAVFTFGLSGLLGFASANPILPGSFFTHVQPVDPSFCIENPITQPAEIIPNTELTGELEFDLFYYSLGGPPDSARVTLEWPAEWSLVSVELCGGTGSAIPAGNTLSILMDIAGATEDFGLAARVVLDAATAGELDLNEPWLIMDGFGWQWVYAVGARAGLLCGDCPPDPWENPNVCVPDLDQHVLEMTVEQGNQVQGMFEARLNDLNQCTATFDSPADYITLEVIEPVQSQYEVTVTADATELAIGMHQTWVWVESRDCTECLEVILEVTEQSPAESASWGQIKSVYR